MISDERVIAKLPRMKTCEIMEAIPTIFKRLILEECLVRLVARKNGLLRCEVPYIRGRYSMVDGG